MFTNFIQWIDNKFQWTLPAQPSRDEERDEHGVRVTGGVLTAAAMTLAGAVAGAFVGILATRRNHKKKKKQIQEV